MTRIVTSCLLWYARHLPYHRGKTRLSRYLRKRFNVHLTGDSVERREGLQWCFDRGDFMSEDLYWSGSNDRDEVSYALEALPKGGVMFDIGANFGYYSITIADRLRQNCTIHAFEPNPATMARFKRNLALNHTRAVIPHNLAVSDRAGQAALVETDGHSGAAYLTSGRDVEVLSLDQFCERFPIDRVDVIKIDAEGSEFAILRGAAATLRRFRPGLLIELNAPALDRQGTSLRDVLALLLSSGYRVYRMGPRREIRSADTVFVEQIFNVLAVPGHTSG